MLEQKNILVVDDVDFSRKRVVKILCELGASIVNIEEASNGQLALDILNKGRSKIDLILSDLNMPIMTGLELLKAIRTSDKEYKDIKFLLITTDSEKEKVIEALKHKVNSYVMKSQVEEKLPKELVRLFI